MVANHILCASAVEANNLNKNLADGNLIEKLIVSSTLQESF